MSIAIVHFDGGCRPTNPGHAAIGVVVYLNGEDGQGQKGHHLSRYIGWRTNNYAEYTACLVAIKFAHQLGATGIRLKSDSQLVVNQIKGKWKINEASLRPFVNDCQRELKKRFPDNWEIDWWRRANNDVADRLCTEAINAGRNRNPFTPDKIKATRPGYEIDPFVNQDDIPYNPWYSE